MAAARYYRWRAALIISFLLLIIYFAFRYRGHLSSAFGWVTEQTGSHTAAVVSIAFALFLLLCFIFWLILPILFYLELRNLRRHSAALVEAAQHCSTFLRDLRNRENSGR